MYELQILANKNDKLIFFTGTIKLFTGRLINYIKIHS